MTITSRALRGRLSRDEMGEIREEEDELQHMIKIGFYNMKNQGENIHPWYTGSRIKALVRMYEKKRNMHHMNIIPRIDPKDKEEYIKFKKDYQYHAYQQFLREKKATMFPQSVIKQNFEGINSLPMKFRIEFDPTRELDMKTDTRFKNLYYYLPQIMRLMPKDYIYRVLLRDQINLIINDKYH